MNEHNLSNWSVLQKLAVEKSELNHCSKLIRANQHSIKAATLELDYCRQSLSDNILAELLIWAERCALPQHIKKMMSGGVVNRSENLPALHTALRVMDATAIHVHGEDVVPGILATRQRMKDISSCLRDGSWLGYSGKPIVSVVNIGMGGSDFGPKLCIDALKEYVTPDLSFHFISDVDPDSFTDVIQQLNPETTLFIVSSKSFTTNETLYNTDKAIAWIGAQHIDKHFIAVTANTQRANNMGFTHILPLWNWIGGRYSLCSAIGLIACIAIGFESFLELLAGAHSMDEHFQHAALDANMPVLMALIGCWNINFLNIPSHLLLIYTKRLELFAPYIQQLDMESNGKSVSQDGTPIHYATGPIVWGGLGNQAHHSYYQLLCQGSHKIAADFISLKTMDAEPINDLCYKTMQVLREGVVTADSAQYTHIPGGAAINHIKLDACTPFSLGALIALYEHKIFVQSVLWNINPFDQPGVNSAKKVLFQESSSVLVD